MTNLHFNGGLITNAIILLSTQFWPNKLGNYVLRTTSPAGLRFFRGRLTIFRFTCFETIGFLTNGVVAVSRFFKSFLFNCCNALAGHEIVFHLFPPNPHHQITELQICQTSGHSSSLPLRRKETVSSSAGDFCALLLTKSWGISIYAQSCGQCRTQSASCMVPSVGNRGYYVDFHIWRTLAWPHKRS